MPKGARKAPNRSTDTSIFIRCHSAQKTALERAAAAMTKDIPGAKLPVHQYVLQAALEKAAKAGFKPDHDDEKGRGGNGGRP
jgi:uncharacterized protein (DUF1778 family)